MTINEVVQNALDNGQILVLFFVLYIAGALSYVFGILILYTFNIPFYIIAAWQSWNFNKITTILALNERKLIEEKPWFKDANGSYHGEIYNISKSDYYILRRAKKIRSVYYLYENETLIEGPMSSTKELCALLKKIAWKDLKVISDTRGYDITFGKEYLVLDEGDLYYEIELDSGENGQLFKSLFVRKFDEQKMK